MFVLFFSYRFLNQQRADNLLSKLKDFSFSSQSSTIIQSGSVDWWIQDNKIISNELLSWLLQNMTLTGTNLGSWELFNELTWMTIVSDSTWVAIPPSQTLNQYTWNTVVVSWLSGKVIVQDIPVETLSVQNKSSVSTKPTTSSSKKLTSEEIREAEMIWSMFSQ